MYVGVSFKAGGNMDALAGFSIFNKMVLQLFSAIAACSPLKNRRDWRILVICAAVKYWVMLVYWHNEFPIVYFPAVSTLP